MDKTVYTALMRGLTCDITTIGRTSGQPRRIEIWYFVVDGRVYISGTPGVRDWYANLQADPRMVFHVKEGARADLSARATLITEPAERRRVMAQIKAAHSYFAEGHLEEWVAGSPLIEVHFDDSPAA